LMMHFVRGLSFETVELTAPTSDIAGRITELYMHLIRQYMSLGIAFMRSFYTPDNQALHTYMGETDGKFAAGTVMARCERELVTAQAGGGIPKKADIHQMSADICTIVKGCIFEWCLSEGKMDIEAAVQRMLKAYMA
uniref:TetR/AcrR family transcriptional regulator n=1 Tax=Anaerovibrio lipolyticus TaxID=82374 RepID=UPI0026EEB266